MGCALVLGGGGVVGGAWEKGVLEGCAEAGVDLALAQVVVGTSAGSIAGVGLLTALDRKNSGAPPKEKSEHSRSSTDAIPGEMYAKLDPDDAKELFMMWAKMTGPDPAVARRLGELARKTDNAGEFMVEAFAAELKQWPKTDMRIATVSTETGERHIFDNRSGVEVSRCMAASSAVPALFPPVLIDGVRYMDGQVHSGTNADILVDSDVSLVVIAAPTNEITANRLGLAAQSCVENEVALLEAAGKQVITVMPLLDDKEAFGSSMMDASHAGSAREVGLRQGAELATKLEDIWPG